VNEENAHDTAEFITKRLNAIKSQRSSGELEDLALVIGAIRFRPSLLASVHFVRYPDGKSLRFALEKPLSASFLELAIMCKAVICCRYSVLLDLVQFPYGVPIRRPCLAVAESTGRQAGQEESEGYSSCHRRWCERRRHDSSRSCWRGHIRSRGASSSLVYGERTLNIGSRVFKQLGRPMLRYLSSDICESYYWFTARGATRGYQN
jgi:hypothetical protein